MTDSSDPVGSTMAPIQFCQRCVQPSTRPDVIFDDEGICLPCRYAETRDQIDWEERRRELEEIAAWGRENSTAGYDCIIGVSGGKDSTRQALYARDELGLKPLLVSCAYPPEQQTERGAYNMANLTALGFDTVVMSPGPETWKEMMRRAYLIFANWCKSTELALYASAPRAAIAYNIPLVFYGENPALAWGDFGGSHGGDANQLKDEHHTLAGGYPTELIGDGISEADVIWYIMPSTDEMERLGMRMVYMGYYIEDFNGYRNAEIAIEHGLRTREEPPGMIGDITGFDALDEDFVIVNQMLKYLKFGFGKVNDQVCEAIRLGRLTRDEGIELIEKYDGRCAPKYIRRFCEYIGITEDEFWEVAERFRHEELLEKNENGDWRLKELPG